MDSCVEKLILFNRHEAMDSPTLYFPFLLVLEAQGGEHVVRLRKPKGTAENVSTEFSMTVSKALYCKPSRKLC